MWDKQNEHNLVIERPKQYWSFDKRYNKYTYNYKFYTQPITGEFFEVIRSFVISKDPQVRQIPYNIGDYITPVTLAYWIMDDGMTPSVKKSGVISQGVGICTDSFSYEEVAMLRDIQINKFNQIVTIHSRAANFRLYISRKSMDILRDQVQEHMVDAMKHKVRIDTNEDY